MSCRACSIVRQIVLNTLLISDKAFNTFLLGDPNETLSRRTARAADSGSQPAKAFCRVLGWFSKNHCAWSFAPGSIGREIWSWSEPSMHAPKTISAPRPLGETE